MENTMEADRVRIPAIASAIHLVVRSTLLSWLVAWISETWQVHPNLRAMVYRYGMVRGPLIGAIMFKVEKLGAKL